MSTGDSPNIPCKLSRFSQEGRTRTHSSTETSSDQQQSHQMRFSNESVNRSTVEPMHTSVVDETFLERLHIDTPTPENVGNTSRQENISSNFL